MCSSDLGEDAVEETHGAGVLGEEHAAREQDVRCVGDADEAQDLLQETYYRFLRSTTTFEDAAHRRNYLYRIATNLVKDQRRRPAVAADPLPPLLVDEAGQPIKSATGWAKRKSALRAEWQTFLGEFPKEKAPLKAEVLATENLPEFTRQLVKYQVEDGVWTDAYVLIPKHATGKLPGVVVFHQTVKTQAQQAAGVDASVPELMHGVQLVQRGYVVVCPRCFIFAEGAGYAEWVKRMQQTHPTWTGMARMTWDGIRAADYLESLPMVDQIGRAHV